MNVCAIDSSLMTTQNRTCVTHRVSLSSLLCAAFLPLPSITITHCPRPSAYSSDEDSGERGERQRRAGSNSRRKVRDTRRPFGEHVGPFVHVSCGISSYLRQVRSGKWLRSSVLWPSVPPACTPWAWCCFIFVQHPFPSVTFLRVFVFSVFLLFVTKSSSQFASYQHSPRSQFCVFNSGSHQVFCVLHGIPKPTLDRAVHVESLCVLPGAGCGRVRQLRRT